MHRQVLLTDTQAKSPQAILQVLASLALLVTTVLAEIKVKSLVQLATSVLPKLGLALNTLVLLELTTPTQVRLQFQRVLHAQLLSSAMKVLHHLLRVPPAQTAQLEALAPRSAQVVPTRVAVAALLAQSDITVLQVLRTHSNALQEPSLVQQAACL